MLESHKTYCIQLLTLHNKSKSQQRKDHSKQSFPATRMGHVSCLKRLSFFGLQLAKAFYNTEGLNLNC